MNLKGPSLLGLCFLIASSARGGVHLGHSEPSRGSRETKSIPAMRSPPRADLSTSFEANMGQAQPEASLIARGRGFTAYLGEGQAVFAVPEGRAPSPAPVPVPAEVPDSRIDILRMRFPGFILGSEWVGTEPQPGRSHYFIGNTPEAWITGVPHFGGAVCRQMWPGVDFRWTGMPGGSLEYSLVIGPGTDPAIVRLAFEGQDSLVVDTAGTLVLRMAGTMVRNSRPTAWQVKDGARSAVAVSFAVLDKGTVGFEFGPRNETLPLFVDPILTASTLFGGSLDESFGSMAVDSSGRTVVVGGTYSLDLPVMNSVQSTLAGSSSADAFISRLSADGSSLVSSTYLGGGGNYDTGYGSAVDSAGNMYLSGYTQSDSFPLKNPIKGSYGANNSGEAFVAKLTPAGSGLVWSTYLGSAGGQDWAYRLAITATGETVVAGATAGNQFPVQGGVQAASAGSVDAFLTKINSTGTGLVWSTYVGGNDTDTLTDMALGPDGSVYFTGWTRSSNLNAGSAFQTSLRGLIDAFAGKVSADGSTLVWLTYLGGTVEEYGRGIAPSSDGGAWVVGFTNSTNFPLQSPPYTNRNGPGDAFVTRISSTGDTLAFSTYLGGTALDESGMDVFEDGAGNAWVSGYTSSSDFPMVDAIQPTSGGGTDAFLAVMSPGSGLLMSTYLGGNNVDVGLGIALHAAGEVRVAGQSKSTNFPISGGFDSTVAGTDIFITSYSRVPVPPPGLDARVAGLTSIVVSWTDSNDIETGYELERKPQVSPNFSPLAVLPPGSTSYLDQGLPPDSSYTYRVRANGAYGDSEWVVSDIVTTPPTPTFPPDGAPSSLQAVPLSPRSVQLTWVDTSSNEDFFLLARAEGGPIFGTLATPYFGASSFLDQSVLPEHTYSWKVKAQNPLGSSQFSNTVSATMPATMDVEVTKGKIANKPDLGKDSVNLGGTFSFREDAQATGFDPETMTLVLRLGDINAPPMLNIIAPAEEWVLKKGKLTWKSPKGSVTKAKVVVDTASNTWLVTLSKVTLTTVPESPVRVTLTLGTDSGHHEADWTLPNKGGILKYPVPIPR